MGFMGIPLPQCDHKCHDEPGLNPWIERCPTCGCGNAKYDPKAEPDEELLNAIGQVFGGMGNPGLISDFFGISPLGIILGGCPGRRKPTEGRMTHDGQD